MVEISIKCIHCNSSNIVKMDKQVNGKPRYKCKTCSKTFQTQHKNNKAKPQTKQQTLKMTTNGSGIRDIARVLNISTNTVMSVLKKQKIS
ncbi:MAG: hypothetical protein LBH62_07690 [Nitrososphaerota archaeon]|nr:hypothetical protein [Nitrososphaerota archaeon]